MAQSGYTPIQLYYSSTTTNVPLAANLASGELAINITDGKLFYKDNANAVQVIGWKVVPATAGGTGQTSYAVGDLLYADTTTTLAKLPDVATGNALISGGVSTAPSWGKIGLTTHVSGTLPTANGGTNLTSFTNKGVMYASSTSALATSAALTWSGSDLIAKSAGNYGSVIADNTNATGGGSFVAYKNGSDIVYFCVSGAYYGNTTSDALIMPVTGKSLRLGANAAETAVLGTDQNIAISTAAKGILFSANTPTAGATSQLLNWYEEGTWTPVVAAGSISGTNLVYTGTYTRIGRAVTITFRANSSSSSNNVVVSSYVVFSGLPFTASVGGTSFTSTEDIDFKRGGEMGVNNGSASLELGACGANPGTSTIYGSLTYIV